MGDKNQYNDVLPYDYNRVMLSIRGTDEDSHYINASYVQVSNISTIESKVYFKSWLREKAYVVTQSVKTKQVDISEPSWIREVPSYILTVFRRQLIFGEWYGN